MESNLKKYSLFLTIFIIYIIISMVIFPSLYISQTLAGLNAWALNVLPSVLPFIFFTKVLSSLGGIEKITSHFPMQRLYRTPSISGYVFLMSIISGYPVGAKMTADLYQSGKVTREEAFRMTSFCSTSGPMFIIGAVGVGMLLSPRAGYIILLSHIIAAFLNGFLYRKIKAKELPHEKIVVDKNTNDLGSMVLDSALSIISVGAIIAIFFVIITSLSPLLSFLPKSIASIFAGLIEITRGCKDISLCLSPDFAICACSFIISFGGISTMLQSLTMLSKIKMPVWLFTLQKFSHAVLALLISILLVMIF